MAAHSLVKRGGKISGRESERSGVVLLMAQRTEEGCPGHVLVASGRRARRFCPMVWILRRLALPLWVGQLVSVRLLMSEPPSSCWLYFLLSIFLTPSMSVRLFVDSRRCHVSHCRQTPALI